MNITFFISDKIHDLVTRIETCLALPSTTNPANSNASDLDSASSNQQNNNHIHAKLPKIEIPKFNGKPIEWQSFLDQCSTGDDSTTNTPDAVKFSYLKSALSKDVHSIPLKF